MKTLTNKKLNVIAVIVIIALSVALVGCVWQEYPQDEITYKQYHSVPNEEDYCDTVEVVTDLTGASLAVVRMTVSSGSIMPKINNVENADGTLKIYCKARLDDGEIGTCDIAYWEIIVPLSSDVLDGIKSAVLILE